MIRAQPLAGCIVGISISESEDLHRLGFDRSEMNRCIVRLSESLLAAGARLAFGHDWRPGGVMEAVAALAVRHFNIEPTAEGIGSRKNAPILNRLAAPDVPFLWHGREAAGEHEATTIHPMSRLLEGIVDAEQVAAPTNASRAEALSLMRRELAELCHVRICLGGRTSGFAGKMPGVIEEAVETLRLRRPVFTSSIFGGASRLITDVMESGRLTPRDDPASPVLNAALADIHRAAAHVRASLNSQEAVRLWQSSSIEECIELTLRGAVKWWEKENE